jgi:hypothetical protein
MAAMVQPAGKAKKIAEKLLGKPKRETTNTHREPQTTGEQAEQQMNNMWRNHVYSVLHD